MDTKRSGSFLTIQPIEAAPLKFLREYSYQIACTLIRSMGFFEVIHDIIHISL